MQIFLYYFAKLNVKILWSDRPVTLCTNAFFKITTSKNGRPGSKSVLQKGT